MADLRDGHDTHDPLLIAGLLDRDPADPDRATAAARLASCHACATLHADLLALSTAARDLPIPPRLRDFMLTPADAARLAAPDAGEPEAPTARLAGVMTGAHAIAAHPAHDTMLVASLVDHSLAAPERAAAEALVASCASCAELHADLLSLRTATRAMPTQARPRDFMLSVDAASRMRPGGWRRFVAAFGSSRDMLTRPLAAGLTTLGLAGLLFAVGPSFLSGSAGASLPTRNDLAVGAPDRTSATAATQDLAGAGAAIRPSAGRPDQLNPVAAAVATSGPTPASVDVFGANASPPRSEAGTGTSKGQAEASQPTTSILEVTDAGLAQSAGPSMLVVLSGSFLIAGLGLFLLRWSARRLGDG